MITEPTIIDPRKEPVYWTTISVAQCARQEICVQLTDLENKPYNLGERETVKADRCDEEFDEGCDDGVEDAPNPGFPDGVEPKRAWPSNRIVLRAAPQHSDPLLFEVDGTVTDYPTGQCVFHLTEEQTTIPGIFVGEILYYNGDYLLKRWPCYISIEESLAAINYQGLSPRPSGVLTIPEIRLSLRDVDATYSEMLEDVEFKDAEIIAAIRKPIDFWNETVPLDAAIIATYQNFPYRGQWLRGTCGYLLEMAAHWYRRNDIPLNAGGMTVNDRYQHQTYEPKAMQLIQEYQTWARETKLAMSMNNAWGTTGSTWPKSSGRSGRI